MSSAIPRGLSPGAGPSSPRSIALAVSAGLHAWVVAGLGTDPSSRPAGIRDSPALSVTLERPLPAAEVPAPAAQGMEDAAASLLWRPPESPPAADTARPPEVFAPRPEGAAASATLPLPDPVYYPARQLDVYPALLEPLELAYPEHAAREQVVGQVTVMLLIDANGVVDEVAVVAAEPAGYFEEAAQASFAAARFSPARKDGRAVKSRVLISVTYGPVRPREALR